MASVLAGIITSIDGYITGPNDGPGIGLGENGEGLHYWVFGGPVDLCRGGAPRADWRGRRLVDRHHVEDRGGRRLTRDV
jgi:hypothetical protein